MAYYDNLSQGFGNLNINAPPPGQYPRKFTMDGRGLNRVGRP